MIVIDNILSFLQGVGGFVFIFGIVVLVHELGHFIAAKLTGVYAPRFSVGFGPGPKKRWGETQYQIGVIPLGGYVRMASREDEATAFLEGGSETQAELEAEEAANRPKGWDPDAMIPFGPKPVPPDRWFESKPLPQRLFILVAGVSMNALLTVVVLFGLALRYGETIVETREVMSIMEMPETSQLRGLLLPGDTILSVQGEQVANWNEIDRQILFGEGDSLVFTTSRGRVAVPAGPPQSSVRQAIFRAIDHYRPPVIEGVQPGMPAERVGLQHGDSIVAINGEPVRTYHDLVQRVSSSAGTPLEFTLSRSGSITVVSVTPETITTTDPTSGENITVGRIGATFTPGEISQNRVGVGTAAALAFRQTGQMAGSIFQTLKGLVQREVSLRELGGPIMIARESANAAQQGMRSLFILLALLSINLAVLNLLPIPVLDGGQILIIVAEAVKGSPFSPRARQFILGTGVALVLLLMLVVSYNDILRIFRN